ncbi:MAG TPA: acetyl-CoA carboxylase carboxyltransferase subunit alpha [Micropepsaceae bacterium]|jgi:acetyl-CoA carboxylase carboxyl transferase subunit alpha|nr:acetyl-CoA carboxylase carboxyltransferase subunit alpha [Micropepsaceae bacterium]
MNIFLDFEKSIADLEGKIEELRQMGSADGVDDGARTAGINIDEEVARLQVKTAQLVAETYARLTPWQKTQVARHPARPHFSDYAASLFAEFTPLAGDRLYGEDKAIVAGLGRFRGRPVAIVGHEKGNDTKSRVKHNFGMAMPEGYRKVQRLFDMANRFGLPVISLIDTAGAYPGIGAEERGQAEAIARSTQACLGLNTPFVATIIGEGGSGGAVAIAAANKVFMLEHAIYSVISPEGCASILWHRSEKAADAAAAMKITAQDLLNLKVIDGIVPEPIGGAHRAPERAIQAVADVIERALQELSPLPADELKRLRREKYLQIGRLETA